MRPVFFLLSIIPFAAISQYKLGDRFLNYKNGTAEAQGITYENLRLYPIIAKDSFKIAFQGLSKFTTLKEALEQKKVVITEAGSGTVNTLYIENTSQDTVILNCGEVIKGGKQDRIISTDMVLYPGKGKQDLSVFCVEQGRWSSNTKANGKDFNGYYNFSANSLRQVVTQEKTQSKVWSKVSDINKVNGSGNATSTYTALDSSKNYKDQIEKYIAFFKKEINGIEDIVGVIVATDNKVIGVDIFATNELFKKNFENLIYSYATEAIINGESVTVSQTAVDTYMNELMDEKKQEQVLKSKGSKLEADGKKLRISSFE